MVEVKAADADAFVAAGGRNHPIILVYGPDSGLVTERADRLIAKALGPDHDPLALVELTADQIAADPGLLSDEARAIGLFGGQRAVRVQLSGNRPIQSALQPLIDDPPEDCLIVVEAGELRKSAPLRKLCEQAGAAAALPCYADDDAALDRLIDDEANAAGLTVSREARLALKALLGGDRRVSRSELQKLCLYVNGRSEITLDDIAAVVGDATAFAFDGLVDAVADGRPDRFLTAWRRLLAEGTPGPVAATLALRHFQLLHRARAMVDAGTPAQTVVERWAPPLFFQRRPRVLRQIQAWPIARIERALARIDKALADSRLGPIPDEIVAEALLAVAASAVRRQPA